MRRPTRAITEELTLTWARALLRLNPKMPFGYCSAGGAGGPRIASRAPACPQSDTQRETTSHEPSQLGPEQRERHVDSTVQWDMALHSLRLASSHRGLLPDPLDTQLGSPEQ
jgi:hypothetical protein